MNAGNQKTWLSVYQRHLTIWIQMFQKKHTAEKMVPHKSQPAMHHILYFICTQIVEDSNNESIE